MEYEMALAALTSFKEKYLFHPRVMEIDHPQFYGDEIIVIFYDKVDTTTPLNIIEYEGYSVEYIGIMGLLKTHEQIYDLHVLNDPNSWDQEEVPFSLHYKNVSRKIAKYELGLL